MSGFAAATVKCASLAAAGAIAGALTLSSPATAAVPVDLELVIATDASGSMDWTELRIQREGIANAFKSREIVQAIQSGALGKIAVANLDWNNDYETRVVIDWTIIHDAASATGYADTLLGAPLGTGRRTSISTAIIWSVALIETNDIDGVRRTIDISGDGPNNYGPILSPVRDEALSKGITINGLPIIVDSPFSGPNTSSLDTYYASCVIGGRGSFAVVARGFSDFATAIRRKLILEISDLRFDTPSEEGAIIPAAAAPRLAQNLPRPVVPQSPTLLRPPAQRPENCDYWGGGGFGGFGRF